MSELTKGRARSRPQFEVTMIWLVEDVEALPGRGDNSRKVIDTRIASRAKIERAYCQSEAVCGLW